MATQNGTGATVPDEVMGGTESQEAGDLVSKGKGKAVAAEDDVPSKHAMEEDDDDDEEEEEGDEDGEGGDGEDEDNMEEIDLDNVIGRRTRGKVIDFAKAAEENPAEEDEDEDEDDDFEAEDDKMDE